MRIDVAGLDTSDPVVQARLAKVAEAVKANPLLVYNNPELTEVHKKQLPFHASKTRIKVYTGGTRAGKSSAGVVDDLIQLLPREFIPEHLIRYKRKDPPFKLRVITPDLLRTMVAIQDVFRKWIPPEAYAGGTWKDSYAKVDKILSLVGGSQVDFMSYEADLDKFGSVALDRVHFDEEPPGEKGEAIYTQSLRRIVDYQGDILFTATPEFGLSWTSTEFWDNRGTEIAPEVWTNDWLTIVRASTHDNPFVPADALSESRMTAEEYKVKVLGEWFHQKGLVFDEFTADRHIVKPPSPEHIRQMDVLVGIDPGYRTTAVSFIGFDKDNVALLFDELYLHENEALPEPTVEQIKFVLRKWQVRPEWYYIDPMARNASLQTGYDNIQSAYQKAGLDVIPANNKVEAGNTEIKRRLQSAPCGFFVSDTCQKWLWERSRYRLDDREDGKYAVVKSNDHLMDATRYVCMSRQWYAPYEPDRPKNHPSFNPNYQPPYKDERFPNPNNPPLGVFS